MSSTSLLETNQHHKHGTHAYTLSLSAVVHVDFICDLTSIIEWYTAPAIQNSRSLALKLYPHFCCFWRFLRTCLLAFLGPPERRRQHIYCSFYPPSGHPASRGTTSRTIAQKPVEAWNTSRYANRRYGSRVVCPSHCPHL